MIILHGIHRFEKKRIAFRNALCSHCKEEHVAEQFQTFDMWHVFFVPLLPLGHRTHWHRTKCGNDPDERTTESPTLLIIGSLVFGAAGLLALYCSITEKKDRAMAAGMGLGLLALAYVLWWLLKYQAREAATQPPSVQPLTGDTCPFCSGKKAASSSWDIFALAAY